MGKDSNKGKYPFIEEINTDDFYYVIDAISIKIGKKESKKVEEKIDEYVEEFVKIFAGEEKVDKELKTNLATLLGKNDIDEGDLELIVNLAKKELYIKKIELFYDEKEDTRGNNEKESDRYPRGIIYKYFEEKFGISRDKIDELVKNNPEFKKFFHEFSASFYCREYEKEYLSRTISER